jgi:predicted AlkP superfamily pyrophosphatase or phosphodiesterase
MAPPAIADQPHNVILFVPDGLRALMVTPEQAPTMAAIRDNGVNFRNPHSLFPTFTTPNASAMATGHYLGDTGDFSNTIYSGFPVPGAGESLTPFLENDPVLGDVDEHFAGDYLDEVTLLAAARRAGISTGTIGKLGPALIFDHTDRTGSPTIVVDDATGSDKGIPLSDEVKTALTAAGLPLVAPSRGDNGKPGTATTPGTSVANLTQHDYFVDVTTKVVLPIFKARNKPFVLVFWSRDPDGTQHNQGDSLNQLTPGINGPASLAAIKNADNDVASLRQALADLGLARTTDIFVSADHGFATISKERRVPRRRRPMPTCRLVFSRRALSPSTSRPRCNCPYLIRTTNTFRSIPATTRVSAMESSAPIRRTRMWLSLRTAGLISSTFRKATRNWRRGSSRRCWSKTM